MIPVPDFVMSRPAQSQVLPPVYPLDQQLKSPAPIEIAVGLPLVVAEYTADGLAVQVAFHAMEAAVPLSLVQLVPVQSCRHSHEYDPGLLVQAPPFWHGVAKHSSTSTHDVSPVPVYPLGQSPQVRPPSVLVQVTRASHPPLLVRHSFTSTHEPPVQV